MSRRLSKGFAENREEIPGAKITSGRAGYLPCFFFLFFNFLSFFFFLVFFFLFFFFFLKIW